jgi:alkyldihydroxyacetonephosphate synthase
LTKRIHSGQSAHQLLVGGTAQRFDPGPPPDDGGEPRLDVWGFKDSRFVINPANNVVLEGSRYPLSGKELPAFLPWVRSTFQADINAQDTHPSQYPTNIPPSRASEDLLQALRGIVGEHLTVEPEQRLRRGHGQTQAEMYAIKYGRLERVPDVVVFPGCEEEVVALVKLAEACSLRLQPYGGGTSVNEALLCPADEARPIVAVDLARMNHIRWIDPINHMACIQAGAIGRHVAAQLDQHGFTLGHEPDSIEFSTVGGWIATHASGMKKNRYGNIEDIVLDMRVVTPMGILSHSTPLPRESLGGDVRTWLLGSEGTCGIITEAIIKIFPAPESQVYGSILFPDLSRGLAFMYELSQSAHIPASARMVDNLQLQINFAIKPKANRWGALKSALEKKFVTRIKGFSTDKMVACTLVFEGKRAEVKAQEKHVNSLAKRHGGMSGGASNGRRGYMLTYGIAYIRDWILNHWLIAESFETSVAWTDTLALIDRVRKRVADEHAARKLPGRPFVTARVTQIYATGVCVYFYFAMYYKGVANPSAVYHEIENAARDEILKAGGSLSHHHGVGRLRGEFLPRTMSEAALHWRAGARAALDPRGTIGGQTSAS